jgi:hypothetical protein
MAEVVDNAALQVVVVAEAVAEAVVAAEAAVAVVTVGTGNSLRFC